MDKNERHTAHGLLWDEGSWLGGLRELARMRRLGRGRAGRLHVVQQPTHDALKLGEVDLVVATGCAHAREDGLDLRGVEALVREEGLELAEKHESVALHVALSEDLLQPARAQLLGRLVLKDLILVVRAIGVVVGQAAQLAGEHQALDAAHKLLKGDAAGAVDVHGVEDIGKATGAVPVGPGGQAEMVPEPLQVVVVDAAVTRRGKLLENRAQCFNRIHV